MTQSTKQSRRHFLKVATATGLAMPYITSNWVSAGSPNSKIQHASIGVGGMMGFNDVQEISRHPKAEIAAICDVDSNHLDNAAKAFPNARKYSDWRELLEKEGNKIDSVNVTVPDHMHYPISYAAIKAGKHVYCQKPLCHDIGEVRRLSDAAAKAKVVTQLGTQHASGIGDRTGVQLIKAGAIGKVKRVILCSNRPGAIKDYRLVGPRPAQGAQPPATLNWDHWIGGAPMRPYSPDIYHPVKWRAWQDFGTGWLGDIGCHIFDAIWKALDLKAPLTAVAEVQTSWQNSPERRGDTWPQSDHITWTFPGNQYTEGKELIIEWFDGEMFPPSDIRALFTEDEYPAESSMTLGTDGNLLIPHTKQPWLLPDAKFHSYPMPKLPSRNHYHHFIDACLGEAKTESHFQQTGPMAEAILLGTVAIRVPGQTLKWDSANMKVTNIEEANKYISRDYRPGWVK
jgi:predicted dehydrogenase